jgi:acyl-CoA thioesterase-2
MRFADILRLEAHGPDTFVASGPRYPWGGLYGGQIIAQALRAAAATVEPRFVVHSLHAYFIRLGDASEPIRLEVDRLRNGRSFVTRRVVARQAVGAILNLDASFQIPEPEAPAIQTERMPDVPPPESLRNDGWSPIIDRRFVDPTKRTRAATAWMRLAEDLGEDPVLHQCALAYLSDDLPTDAIVACHPGRGAASGADAPSSFWNASLDHAIWFHRPLRADESLLLSFECHGLISSRGLSIGAVFARDGRHLATVSQEVLTRPQRAPTA